MAAAAAPAPTPLAYAHAGKISKERIKRSRLLNKISGIRLNFVITETFKKLPPPPPPPPHTHTQKMCFLDARALRTVGSARAHCVGGGGAAIS